MLKCILGDFGDTLADERWMLQPLDGVPEWAEAWTQVAGGELADAWNRALAAHALEFLGTDIHPSEALLIDNKRHNVESWERRSGRRLGCPGVDSEAGPGN